MAINDTQLLGLKAQLQDTGPGGLGAVTVTSGGGETNTLAAFWRWETPR